ncbi:hypothetical protein M0802_000920 [Mischocyttarus mexicanus]|nr:hypothetical protein M0802_000920 [Mischocyttarus mexicanus]
MTKKLCVNFTYETNRLNVNITLNTIILTNRIVTEYKPFKICSQVPGSLFSSVCANILELNRFPSISTELPMMTSTQSSGSPAGQMPGMPAGQMPGMPAGQMSGMPAGQMPEMPGMTPGQMPGMPPGQMPGMPSG